MPMSSVASTAVVYVSRSKPLLYLVRLGCIRRFVARARQGATWFVCPASSEGRCAPTADVQSARGDLPVGPWSVLRVPGALLGLSSVWGN